MEKFTKVAKTTAKAIKSAASTAVENSPAVAKEAGKGVLKKCFGILTHPVAMAIEGTVVVVVAGCSTYKYIKGKKAKAAQTQPAGTDFEPVDEQPKPAQK